MNEPRKPRSYDFSMDLVSQKIEEAAARGEFDNLPGEGKPLDLSENPFAPPEWRLAFKILKENGFAPEFVTRRKTIETMREEMSRTRHEPDLRRLALKLADEVDALNRSLIGDSSIRLDLLQLPPVDVEAEVARYLRPAK